MGPRRRRRLRTCRCSFAAALGNASRTPHCDSPRQRAPLGRAACPSWNEIPSATIAAPTTFSDPWLRCRQRRRAKRPRSSALKLRAWAAAVSGNLSTAFLVSRARLQGPGVAAAVSMAAATALIPPIGTSLHFGTNLRALRICYQFPSPGQSVSIKLMKTWMAERQFGGIRINACNATNIGRMPR